MLPRRADAERSCPALLNYSHRSRLSSPLCLPQADDPRYKFQLFRDLEILKKLMAVRGGCQGVCRAHSRLSNLFGRLKDALR